MNSQCSNLIPPPQNCYWTPFTYKLHIIDGKWYDASLWYKYCTFDSILHYIIDIFWNSFWAPVIVLTPQQTPFPPPVSESCELLSVVVVGMINVEVLGASKGNALLHILSAWIKLGLAELHIVMGSGPQHLKQETNYWDWTQADYFTQQYKGKFGKNPQLGPPSSDNSNFFELIELIITKYYTSICTKNILLWSMSGAWPENSAFLSHASLDRWNSED